MSAAAGQTVTALRGERVDLAAAAEQFLSSTRLANPHTYRAYASAIDRTVALLGPDRLLPEVADDEIGAALTHLWDRCAPATWNRNRAAVASWLTWCRTKKRWAAPCVPDDVERRRETSDETKAVAKTTIHRLLSRRDVPLREKTLWRMLYETAARAGEILALNVEDLDLEGRRAPVRSKGGATEWVYWESGTAHLLPRLLRLPDGSTRTHGPLFLSMRRPVPARRPAAADICPHTGRARLGYDRARVQLEKYAGLDLHQLRHSAATHLGEAEVPLQLIMAKTRHKNPRTAMRYVQPGAEAVSKITEVLAPRGRTH
ncbi:site-specific integrase [Planomonospora sp. ID91781]|uniref:tyrosine-type recombinase/integrase n=1 Tax=Planomonospora sp. ID91781 TaxID=2738135 RepID=UPI0027DB2259|nr:site-specific integrase [Planomonospora sp. ID91781]